ncbi:unnamed protein product, partial [Linum tenue]
FGVVEGTNYIFVFFPFSGICSWGGPRHITPIYPTGHNEAFRTVALQLGESSPPSASLLFNGDDLSVELISSGGEVLCVPISLVLPLPQLS